MQSQPQLQRLLQRHGEIQRAMRRPGGIRITVERELYAIREELKNFPDVLQALQSSHENVTRPSGG
ncbi:MAG TPA: hypothetical protein VHX52_00155 [Steroidobacteraceae bacterium]|jgi:hypothetical protein|nr:hypothetical protein [Steroidobacteraceae bacterium]